jgi:hypothetical protein
VLRGWFVGSVPWGSVLRSIRIGFNGALFHRGSKMLLFFNEGRRA